MLGMKASISKIRMIIGGIVIRGSLRSLKKAYAREVNSVQSKFSLSKIPQSSEPDIIFSEMDACGKRLPHDKNRGIQHSPSIGRQ